MPARQWNQLKRKMHFRVTSYNILAQCYANSNPQLYSKLANPDTLKWHNRWPLLKTELMSLGSDIFCLQEVQADHFEHEILPFLTSNHYTTNFVRKRAPLQDGTLISFKTDTFKLIEVEEVHMYDEYYAKSGQVGLVCALQHKQTNECLVIGSTHLAFNPYRGDWKLHQAVHLMATINDVVKRISNGCAVIVCGDMNSAPNSPMHQYFVNPHGVDFSDIKAKDVSGQPPPGESHYRSLLGSVINGIKFFVNRFRHGQAGESNIEPNNLRRAGFELDSTFANRHYKESEERHYSIISNKMELKSAYDNKQPTTVLSYGQQCVDYVFYNSHLTLSSIQDMKMPVSCECLPNEHFGSDHLSLNVNFSFRRD